MSAATESVISRLNARVRPHNPRGAARPPQRALREVDSGAVCSALCVPCSVRRSVRCRFEVRSVQCAVQCTPPGAARGAEEEELVRREEDSGPQGGDRSILIRPKSDCTFLTSFNVCNLSKSCLGKSECTADLFQTGIPPCIRQYCLAGEEEVSRIRAGQTADIWLFI